MNENLEIENYFGTPIYQNYSSKNLKIFNEKTDNLIKNFQNENKHIINQRNKNLSLKLKDYGFIYNYCLKENSNFKNFQEYLKRRSFEILDHMGYNLNNHEIILKEFTVQQFAKQGGVNLEGKNFQKNHLNGFYFLKTSSKTPFLIFNDPRNSNILLELPFKNLSDVTFSNQLVGIIPKSGSLIIFPSYLKFQFSTDYGIDCFRFIYFSLKAVSKT